MEEVYPSTRLVPELYDPLLMPCLAGINIPSHIIAGTMQTRRNAMWDGQ